MGWEPRPREMPIIPHGRRFRNVTGRVTRGPALVGLVPGSAQAAFSMTECTVCLAWRSCTPIMICETP